MLIDLQKLDEIKYAFSDLGYAVGDLSDKNEEYFSNVLSFLDKFKANLDLIIPKDDLKEMQESSAKLDSHVSDLSKLVDSLSSKFDGVDSLNDSLENASAKFSKMSSSLDGIDKASSGGAAKKALEAQAKKKSESKIGRYASKEIQGVNQKFNSLLSTMKIPKLGGIAAGLIGIMAYGVMDKQRVTAEFGQVADIMVNAVDRSVQGVMAKATQWASNFQEKLQKSFGIAKEETQGVIKAFTEGGIAASDWQRGQDARLGLVGSNIASWSLGMDKLLNLGGGASAQRMADYAAKYNMTLDQSKRLMTDMAIIGEQDQVGRIQFMKNMEAGGEALSNMGFSLEGLVQVAEVLQKRLGGADLSKQFVGKYVGQGLKEAATSLASMDDKWYLFFAEKMGYGKGIDALVKFKDSYARMSTGKGSADEFQKLMTQMGAIALDVFENDEATARQFLETGPNQTTRSAKLILDLAKLDIKGEAELTLAERNKKNEIARNLQKDMKDSFTTEKERRTKWEIGMNKWMKGLAKLGQGLLGQASLALIKMVAYTISAPSLLMNLFRGDKGAAQNEILLAQLRSFEFSSKENSDKMIQGLRELKSSASELFKSIGGDQMIRNMEALGKLNPYSLAAGKASVGMFGGSAASNISSILGGTSKSVGSIAAPSTVQIVMVPTASPGIYEVPSSEEESFGPDGYSGSDWAGGEGLRIVSYGVAQSGDINLAVVGACPRCGLKYDSGFNEGAFNNLIMSDQTSDLNVLTQMLYSEGSPGRIYDKRGKEELAGIANTAFNRSKASGKSLYDVITGGHGWGKQGKKRAYGTAREVTPANKKEYEDVRDFASKLLAGEVDNPVGAATSFYHDTGAAGYLGGTAALPIFADPALTNNALVARIGKANFMAPKGKGKDIANRAEVQGRQVRAYEAARTSNIDDSDDYATETYQD